MPKGNRSFALGEKHDSRLRELKTLTGFSYSTLVRMAIDELYQKLRAKEALSN